VQEGEVVALLGANGAGKTTTLRALSGLIPALAGSIHFQGRPIHGLGAEKIARMGLLQVPEGRGIFRTLGVDETLKLAANLARVAKAEVMDRVDEVYATFPRLKERRNQPAGMLSGGEQQMLALARGLIARPRLLMIDEMSQGLAPTIVADLFEIVAAFPARGVSVLLVEQFVGRALEVANRAYVLEKGEVSFAGKAASLAADESFVRSSYLGSVATEEVEAAEAGGAEAAGAVAVGAGAAGRNGNGHALLGEEVRVTLPAAMLRGLEERAQREGVSADDLVRELVTSSLSGNGGRRRGGGSGGEGKGASAGGGSRGRKRAESSGKADSGGRRRGGA
jgi:branched-chain amino acid transport system ATP-binding protein